MKIKRPKIKLIGIQIKSLRAAKKLAKGIDLIEANTGIHSVKILIEDPFLRPDINLNKLDKTPTENLVRIMLKDVRKIQYGLV